MEGIVALVMIFGMPVFIVGLSKYFKFKTKKLELEAGESQQKLLALENERKLLEGRVQNLETVVTSVDYELNNRLNRLAAHQSQLLLAAPDEGTAPTMAVVPPLAGELPPGGMLSDRFEVKQTIGRGGMGAVYLAHDRQLGEDVALKVIAQNLVEDPEAAERFRREVGAARKITHPNVIRIHDLGDDGGLVFMTMEYFPSQTLQQRLTRGGGLPLDEVRRLLGPICDALEAAHNAGIVHRDLKPLNILVNESNDVRIIDFGLAKASYMTNATATGMILGTPEYMAPEQVSGKPVDHRADLYALAAITFAMLCGHPPFSAETPIAVGFMQVTQAPPSARQVVPSLPPTVDEAIIKGLAKDPAARFDSAAAFKRAIG